MTTNLSTADGSVSMERGAGGWRIFATHRSVLVIALVAGSCWCPAEIVAAPRGVGTGPSGWTPPSWDGTAAKQSKYQKYEGRDNGTVSPVIPSTPGGSAPITPPGSGAVLTGGSLQLAQPYYTGTSQIVGVSLELGSLKVSSQTEATPTLTWSGATIDIGSGRGDVSTNRLASSMVLPGGSGPLDETLGSVSLMKFGVVPLDLTLPATHHISPSAVELTQGGFQIFYSSGSSEQSMEVDPVDVVAIPEPIGGVQLALGGGILALFRRRRPSSVG